MHFLGNESTPLLTKSPFTEHPCMRYSLMDKLWSVLKYTVLAWKMPKAYIVESPADKYMSQEVPYVLLILCEDFRVTFLNDKEPMDGFETK